MASSKVAFAASVHTKLRALRCDASRRDAGRLPISAYLPRPGIAGRLQRQAASAGRTFPGTLEPRAFDHRGPVSSSPLWNPRFGDHALQVGREK